MLWCPKGYHITGIWQFAILLFVCSSASKGQKVAHWGQVASLTKLILSSITQLAGICSQVPSRLAKSATEKHMHVEHVHTPIGRDDTSQRSCLKSPPGGRHPAVIP